MSSSSSSTSVATSQTSSSSISMLNEESSSQSSESNNLSVAASSSSTAVNNTTTNAYELNSLIAANSTDINNQIQSASGVNSITGIESLDASEEPSLKKTKFSDVYHELQNSQVFNEKTSNTNKKRPIYISTKKLEERIGGILCCTVCLDLPITAMYQCTNGHLMCAGCFSHLLADARLKDEQATCPNCRCEITKQNCCRNLAVEKTLSELPANCDYCNMMYPRNLMETHQKNECLERPTKCLYKRLGCTWEGPYHEIDIHSEQCIHPNKPAKEIMSYLKDKDTEVREEQQTLLQLCNFLSFEKVCFNDLQFKQYKTDEITPKLYFETNRFSAFFHQWVLKARVNDNQKNPNLSLNRYISYQLILKSKLSSSQSSLDVKYCVLKGPFGEVNINPSIQSFEFTQSRIETDYIRLNITSTDCNKLLAAKTINFRFFMFQP